MKFTATPIALSLAFAGRRLAQSGNIARGEYLVEEVAHAVAAVGYLKILK